VAEMRVKNKESPRMECGALIWYQGDTFSLDLELELEDEDGESVTLGANDSVSVIFHDRRNTAIKTFSFPAVGSTIQNNTVTLVFDAVATALFPRGEYEYDVIITSEGNRITLERDSRAVVE